MIACVWVAKDVQCNFGVIPMMNLRCVSRHFKPGLKCNAADRAQFLWLSWSRAHMISSIQNLTGRFGECPPHFIRAT